MGDPDRWYVGVDWRTAAASVLPSWEAARADQPALGALDAFQDAPELREM